MTHMFTIDSIFAALPVSKLHLFAIIFLAVLVATLIAVLLDLRDGIATARRCGQTLRSNKYRVTVGKIIEYWQFVLLAFIADCVASFLSFYSLPYLAMLFGLGVIMIEAKSMFEHAKRRKSGAAKLPAAVADIAEWVGGVDELRALLSDMARSHAERAALQTDNSDYNQTPII